MLKFYSLKIFCLCLKYFPVLICNCSYVSLKIKFCSSNDRISVLCYK